MVTTVMSLQSLGNRFTTARQMASDQAGQSFQQIRDRYQLLERYYWNEQYDFINGTIQALKATQGLYRNIRPIRNPFKRAVDWYPGNLFPGAMTPDGLALPDGTPSCLGYATDTDETVRLAMTQAMVWGNWGQSRWDYGRNFAILGDQFGEVEVDYVRNKVYPRFHHPGYVTDIAYNGSGDIVEYRLEIPQYDEVTKRSYVWGKIVTKETVTTLYDGKPMGYDGQDAVTPNQWGFCPAAWAQFRNVGGQHGASLVDGVRSKIDELNSSLAAIHDFINRFSNQGVIVKTGSSMKDLLAQMTPGGPTSERDNPQGGRQEVRMWKFPADATIDKPLQNLGLGEATAYMEQQANEIEADLPESTIGDRIRQYSSPPSGRALSMLFGQEEKLLAEAQGSADHMLVKLQQMCVTIGGHLVNSGAWGMRSQLSQQQQRFLPFDLNSFDNDELSVTIVPRPLFSETPEDRAAYALSIEQLTTRTGMQLAGVSDETIDAMFAELDGQPKLSAIPTTTPPTTAPNLAADPNSALAFFQRHVGGSA